MTEEELKNWVRNNQKRKETLKELDKIIDEAIFDETINQVVEKEVEEPWLFEVREDLKDFYNMLRKKYKITNEAIKQNALVKTEDGYKTSFKELVGDGYIRQNNIFSLLFNNVVRYEKVINKEEQLSGIDYKVYLKDGSVKNVDLKSLVGPSYKRCVVELTQFGKWTNTEDKKTDEVLYIVHDKNHSAYKMVSYQEVKNEAAKYKKKLVHNPDGSIKVIEPKGIKVSSNKSGEYVMAWDI